MLVGYARLSEFEPQADLEAQRRVLTAFGCEKAFTGASTAKGPQDAREAALAFMREGDTLVVARPDRLARTPAEILKIADGLTKRGCGLVVLSGFGPMLDTRDPACAALMTALRGIAKWERACKLELQIAGTKRARLADPSKYRGGKQRVSPGAIEALAGAGLRPIQIARILKIHRTTVHTYLPADYRVPRVPKRIPRERLDARVIQQLLASGLGATAVAKIVGCERRSVYRLGYGT